MLLGSNACQLTEIEQSLMHLYLIKGKGLSKS